MTKYDSRKTILQDEDQFLSAHDLDLWIHHVCTSFVKAHSIEPYEKDDLSQFVHLRFSESYVRIRSNYKSNASVRTYIYAVILNFCREFRRKKCGKSVFTVPIEASDVIQEHFVSVETPIIKDIYFKEELRRLEYVFKILRASRSKILIALATIYRTDLDSELIFEYTSDSSLAKEFHLEILRSKENSRKELIVVLNKWFNRTESENRSEDALRKWIDRCIDRVISMLNSAGSAHSRETLGILLELYMQRRQQEKT